MLLALRNTKILFHFQKVVALLSHIPRLARKYTGYFQRHSLVWSEIQNSQIVTNDEFTISYLIRGQTLELLQSAKPDVMNDLMAVRLKTGRIQMDYCPALLGLLLSRLAQDGSVSISWVEG